MQICIYALTTRYLAYSASAEEQQRSQRRLSRTDPIHRVAYFVWKTSQPPRPILVNLSQCLADPPPTASVGGARSVASTMKMFSWMKRKNGRKSRRKKHQAAEQASGILLAAPPALPDDACAHDVVRNTASNSCSVSRGSGRDNGASGPC